MPEQRVTILYRSLIIAHVLFYVGALVVGLFFSDSYTDKVFEFRSSIHPGLRFSSSVWTSLFVGYMFTWLVGLIGMWFYWRPARILMLVSIIIGLTEPYIMGLGPVINSHPTADLSIFSEMCFGAFIVLSFVNPVSKKFAKAEAGSLVT